MQRKRERGRLSFFFCKREKEPREKRREGIFEFGATTPRIFATGISKLIGNSQL